MLRSASYPLRANKPVELSQLLLDEKKIIRDQSVSITINNNIHVDAATHRVTVYAQTRLLGKVVATPQIGPGECTEGNNGETVCFHPNAVYLNGSVKELMEADES